MGATKTETKKRKGSAYRLTERAYVTTCSATGRATEEGWTEAGCIYYLNHTPVSGSSNPWTGNPTSNRPEGVTVRDEIGTIHVLPWDAKYERAPEYDHEGPYTQAMAAPPVAWEVWCGGSGRERFTSESEARVAGERLRKSRCGDSYEIAEIHADPNNPHSEFFRRTTVRKEGHTPSY